ncbi:DNA polymerase zeta catalytic subunit [Desmophyllum pertusum]|uniref:DNA polymerase zeta catalytic subunit n=1 Tax=Desmophyllum pertusum TaxID=174260 RepID=A0A9W9YSQ3_9CNID|nr:DNA polymerase zeta catalytic subunit [Desmophyllum pertusum]
MGDGDVVVTPCRGPPAPEAVKAWARQKLIKRGVQKQGTDPALKNSEPRSNDENLDKVENGELSEQRNMNSNVSKSPKLELDLAIPEASTSKIHLQEVTRQSSGPSVDPELESLVDNKHKVTDGVAGDKKIDAMKLSDSSSPAEITSPGSLFSPNERLQKRLHLRQDHQRRWHYANAVKVKRLETSVETSGKMNLGNQASSDQTPSLRQQLLAICHSGSQTRRLMPWSSQIEGPSPNNTYGFKVTQMNLQSAKALHEGSAFDTVQFIASIFATLGIDTKEKSNSNTENTALLSPSTDAQCHLRPPVTYLCQEQLRTQFIFRPLLSRSGVTDHEVQYVATRKRPLSCFDPNYPQMGPRYFDRL